MRNLKLGLIENWLRYVQDVMRSHETLLSELEDEAQRLNSLCELNVIEQVMNVSRTTIVQSAWRNGQELAVHGWIYKLEDGLLHDLGLSITNPKELAAAYEKAARHKRTESSPEF